MLGRDSLSLQELILPDDLPKDVIEDRAIILERPNGGFFTFYFSEGDWVEISGRNTRLVQDFDNMNNYIGWRMTTDNVTEVYNTQGQLLSRNFVGNFSQRFVLTIM